MSLKPKFIVGGLISEAWARSKASYSRSLDYYNIRVRDNIQPRTPFVNIFDVKQQYMLLVVANVSYLLITMALFVYMKKRQTGFRLRWSLVIYDAINVILAAYIAVSTMKYKLSHGGLLLCNPIANDVEGYKIAKVFVLFYLQKYFEFIDTWFFILRKSSRQVTFLHLFHHSSITIVVGTILPFDYNGDMYLPILLNSANHMLVYLHYLLASLGQQSWWAPYITSMQLAQFCLIFGQSLLSYRVGPTCGSPDFAKILMIVYMGSLIALFGHFFLQKYIFRRPASMVDLCGVVKNPTLEVATVTDHCGLIELNEQGVGVVYLSADFPDPALNQRISVVNNIMGTYPSFQITYQLTPIGSSMPSLHVYKEISRYKIIADDITTTSTTNTNTPNKPPLPETKKSEVFKKSHHSKKSGNNSTNSLQSIDSKSQDLDNTTGVTTHTTTNTGTSSGGGGIMKREKRSNSHSVVTHTTTSQSLLSTNNTTSSAYNNNNNNNNNNNSQLKGLSSSSSSSSLGSTQQLVKSLSNPDNAKNQTIPGNDESSKDPKKSSVTDSTTTHTGTASVNSSGNNSISKCKSEGGDITMTATEDDIWWKSVQVEAELNTGLSKPSTNSSNNNSGNTSILRSSSTGNLPTVLPSLDGGRNQANSNNFSKNLSQDHLTTAANAAGNTLHNDRLIDGPIPLLGPKALVETYRRKFGTNTTDENTSNSTVTWKDKSQSSSSTNLNEQSADGIVQTTEAHSTEKTISQIRPLCFIIAGGTPNGKVSWYIKTIPIIGPKNSKLLTSQADWRSIS